MRPSLAFDEEIEAQMQAELAALDKPEAISRKPRFDDYFTKAFELATEGKRKTAEGLERLKLVVLPKPTDQQREKLRELAAEKAFQAEQKALRQQALRVIEPESPLVDAMREYVRMRKLADMMARVAYDRAANDALNKLVTLLKAELWHYESDATTAARFEQPERPSAAVAEPTAIERARAAIEANPEKSNRSIAEEIGVTEITVRRARKNVAPDVAPDRRIGQDGKTYKLPDKQRAVPTGQFGNLASEIDRDDPDAPLLAFAHRMGVAADMGLDCQDVLLGMIRRATIEDWDTIITNAQATARIWEKLAKHLTLMPAPPAGSRKRKSILSESEA